MRARLITILALAALTAPTGCGQSGSESAAVEAPNGEVAAAGAPLADEMPVPVAVRNDALPAAFPHDIPIPEGLTAKSVLSEHAGSYAALFTGELEPEVVYRFFAAQLVSEGWTIDKSHGVGPELALLASKGGRITTVICTRIDGMLHVELGVSGGS
ncbi:MAG: hypothetical protein FJ108_10580 [Deltaproteobacteria bacterium]|nr:hypothetical protein [Deltaproteobacteria bacterium]